MALSCPAVCGLAQIRFPFSTLNDIRDVERPPVEGLIARRQHEHFPGGAEEVAVALTRARVMGVLERVVAARGAPAVITVDNGSEFYSRRADAWAY
jgi:hypothetical protein